MNEDYVKSDGKITEEELKPLLEEIQKTPDVEEPAPVLTEEQQKALRVLQAGKIFKGGNARPGANKVGITRANHSLTKKAEKMAKKSRKRSRGKS